MTVFLKAQYLLYSTPYNFHGEREREKYLLTQRFKCSCVFFFCDSFFQHLLIIILKYLYFSILLWYIRGSTCHNIKPSQLHNEKDHSAHQWSSSLCQTPLLGSQACGCRTPIRYFYRLNLLCQLNLDKEIVEQVKQCTLFYLTLLCLYRQRIFLFAFVVCPSRLDFWQELIADW